ncbi:MAG: hypothetical protein CME32_06340 [Gimesia sp.]|nr:hypothetical protein [Gimesia sp.]
MSDTSKFLATLSSNNIKSAERLVALLWFLSNDDHALSMTPRELCSEIEQAGLGKQNVSRAKEQMTKDRRTVKATKDSFRISANAREKLMAEYSEFVDVVPIERLDSVLPEGLFKSARGYTQKVVRQLNASYHHSMFDCSAVMCRRLLETLIIEGYENAKEEAKIKKNGNFKMLSGLINSVENDGVLTLGRNALQGLKDCKNIGDLSAHSRRYNARKSDIDKISGGLRVACEELLHLAGQAS